MPDKKKQHYVPKLLLRHFSNDAKKKLINIFNVDTHFYRVDCPLDSQGQENYFYGSDGVIEDGLGKLESLTSPILNNIVGKKVLPKRGTQESESLFLFTLFLAYRTKNSVEHLNEIVDKTFQEIKKLDSRFSDDKYKDLHIQLNNAASISLGIVAKKAFMAYDLESVLLVNETERKFISSDHPAIRYNQFLENKNHPGGHLGMFTKGLQLFFPISPDHMIVYYDKWAYKFGNKKDKIIYLKNPKDVEQLNYLQVVNCTEIVFSTQHTKEISLALMSEKAKNLRSKDRTKLYEINKRYKDEDDNEHIQYTQQADDRQIKLQLSFIKQNQNAKSHKLSNYFVQLRDEQLRYHL